MSQRQGDTKKCFRRVVVEHFATESRHPVERRPPLVHDRRQVLRDLIWHRHHEDVLPLVRTRLAAGAGEKKRHPVFAWHILNVLETDVRAMEVFVKPFPRWTLENLMIMQKTE